MTITPTSFEIHPSSGVPIYLQVISQIETLIVGGRLHSGDMLPSVREMAAELGVNMMTISKAYSKLEADGVLERVRGRGMLVSKQNQISSVPEKLQELRPEFEQLAMRGKQLGLTNKQLKDLLNDVLKQKST